MRGARTERLIRTVSRFLRSPSKQLSLTQLAEAFGVSKTVISDDVSIIDRALKEEGLGRIAVDRGRTGGASFLPGITPELRDSLVEEIVSKLSSPERVLPGGLVYYSDILFNPSYSYPLGMIMATIFKESEPDIVLTTEVKGIPLGMSTAHALGVPLAVCRFRNRASDGSAVTVHYPTQGGDVRAMYLGTKVLSPGKRVLIIDDFMRGGSTASGMALVVKEFNAHVAGMGFFMASSSPETKAIDEYRSLITLEGLEQRNPRVRISDRL